jgi:hypothetical protein
MKPLASSYRDPDGYVFEYNGKIYRCIKPEYFSDYQLFLESGLYQQLTDAGYLIAHTDINNSEAKILDNAIDKIILPEQVPFITYPYEWSFNMWKDAALLTLRIANMSLQRGIMLKDATPFNIQFYNGGPVFIDTLSFAKYETDKPWVAYRQFCECFLGPLLLMHYNYNDAGKLIMIYPNGIPLRVVKSLLPSKTRWNLHVYLHVWLQEKLYFKSKNKEPHKGAFSKQQLTVLIKGLTDFIGTLNLKKTKSAWDDYYKEAITRSQYLESKKIIFENFAKEICFNTVLDLGANDGLFSLLLKEKAKLIVATDEDSNCIDKLYNHIKKEKIKNIVPVLNDFVVPSPAIGWGNAERTSINDRFKGDLILALALVHHLAIGANIPLSYIAQWLSQAGQFLIIEFVPKSDEKVKQLLGNREDIFPDYNLQNFKEVFSKYYTVLKEEKAGNTDRILYLMKKNN